jgi:hypothetical protein
VARHETRQVTPQSTVTLLRFVSFRFVSFHSILPTPHYTPARRAVSLAHPSLPFPSSFPRLDSLPLGGITCRPVHAWLASPCCRLQTAERGEPAGTLARVRGLRLGWDAAAAAAAATAADKRRKPEPQRKRERGIRPAVDMHARYVRVARSTTHIFYFLFLVLSCPSPSCFAFRRGLADTRWRLLILLRRRRLPLLLYHLACLPMTDDR